MVMRSLLLLLFVFAAEAKEAGLPLPDRGVALPFDPYEQDAALTTGRMEGFRRLFVDPNTYPDSITPTQGGEGTKADLPIHNGTSAYVHVSIGGTKIGQIRPFDTAILHDVKPGTYTIQYTLPHGYEWTESVSTVAK